MIEIPTNTITVDPVIENTIARIVEELKKSDWVQVTNRDINKEQAIRIADEFRAKGYHHEIRMHSNWHGHTFFYCLNIFKTPNRTNDARFSWSEYVR